VREPEHHGDQRTAYGDLSYMAGWVPVMDVIVRVPDDLAERLAAAGGDIEALPWPRATTFLPAPNSGDQLLHSFMKSPNGL
jgi:hypothetical protein